MDASRLLPLVGALGGLVADAEAQSCGALDFDGVDDCVLVPYDPSFPGAVFSAAAWIEADSAGPGRRAIVARGEDDVTLDGPWFVQLSPTGTVEVQIEDAAMNNGFYDSGYFVADGSWHHVLVTREASGTLRFHVDGVERSVHAGTNVPSPDNEQDLSIGCTHGFIGPPPGGVQPRRWFFDGRIDEVAVWNVALGPAEVTAVHAAGVLAAPAGLVAYWALDEGADQGVGDSTAAGIDGHRGAEPFVDAADPAWTTVGPCEPGVATCLGDGTGGACPCGNDGGPGEGCATSTGAGTTLVGSGSTSVSADDLVLTIAGIPTPDANGLVFMGSSIVAPFVPASADGFACTGGGLRFAGILDDNVPPHELVQANLVAASVAGGVPITSGATWHFQGWTRDNAGGPCGGASNLSNAYSVTFGP